MDNLVLEYRDPIIGILLLVFMIFLISFFTYSYGVYKEKSARKDYRKLSRRFELGNLKENDYINLYKTYNLPFDSILLLASTFLHKGDNNKAISVYLALLEHVKDRVKKGGHNVNTGKLRARYLNTLQNLYPAIKVADKVFLFDNSEKIPELVAEIENEKMKINTNSLPNWFYNFVLPYYD